MKAGGTPREFGFYADVEHPSCADQPILSASFGAQDATGGI
jgi:hypothetical protein